MARRQARSLDVAKRAGVSRTTVSFVLNDVPGVKISEETRQRVLRAARELNYYPTAAARSLASGKTHRIGLILGEGQEHLGADAFLLQNRFMQLQAGPDVLLRGHTGLISMDPQLRLHRELPLATFDRGEIRPQ